MQRSAEEPKATDPFRGDSTIRNAVQDVHSLDPKQTSPAKSET
jgi:hypothetical protein